MSKQEYGPLAFGVYDATEAFRSIQQHSAVCRPDSMELVATTGPAGDRESERFAELFAAAPDLLEVVQAFVDLYFCPDTQQRREAGRRAFGLALLALKKARGEGGEPR